MIPVFSQKDTFFLDKHSIMSNYISEVELMDNAGRTIAQYIVENIPGVLSFVGPKGKPPVPLRDTEIKRIFGEVERKEGMEIIEASFKKGDAIKVIAGPFIDFTGLVESVNEDKQKVKVSVSIFGRPTPIELDFFQIEIEK